MSDWYLDTSAIYDGDGTSIAQAGFDGDVGAAKDFRTLFLNTHPYVTTMAAGDNIYIRTHDGTTDCEFTLTADLTSALPSTYDLPIKIFFDAGDKWAGDAGVFYLKLSTNSVQFMGTNSLEYYADGTKYRFCIKSMYVGAYHDFGGALRASFSDGVHLHCETANCFTSFVAVSAEGGNLVIQNFKFTGRMHNNASYPLISLTKYANTLFINPVFDFTADVVHSDLSAIFKALDAYTSLDVIGGKIIASWPDIHVFYGEMQTTKVRFRGFDVGDAENLLVYTSGYLLSDSNTVCMLGCSGAFDATYKFGNNVIEYRKDNLAPYLDSTLPDASNTGWSYKVKGLQGNRAHPCSLVPIEKLYTQTSAVKILTVEFLIDITFTVLADELFAVFNYVDDSTGDLKTISTRVSGSVLASSSAIWTNDTYGSRQFSAKKLTVTTPTAIKQYSIVNVVLKSSITQISTQDLYFYNPDVGIS